MHTTAYKATKHIINPALKAAGLKELPPQMLYSYMQKGYIESAIVEGQKLLEVNDVNRWLDAYISRKLEAKQAEAQEVAEQLAGK